MVLRVLRASCEDCDRAPLRVSRLSTPSPTSPCLALPPPDLEDSLLDARASSQRRLVARGAPSTGEGLGDEGTRLAVPHDDRCAAAAKQGHAPRRPQRGNDVQEVCVCELRKERGEVGWKPPTECGKEGGGGRGRRRKPQHKQVEYEQILRPI